MSLGRRSLFLVALPLVALLGGCAFTYTIPPEKLPPSAGTAMVERWPVEVGVYFAPAVKTSVAADAAWRVPLGDAIVSTLSWSLAQRFKSVRMIERQPSAVAPSDLKGIIAFRDITVSGGTLSGTAGKVTSLSPTLLVLDIELWAPDGTMLATWKATGRGEWGPFPIISWSEVFNSVASDYTLALRDAAAVFLTRFAAEPGVRQWLSAMGVVNLVEGPTFTGHPDERQAAPRVVLLTDAAQWRYGRTGQAMTCLGSRLAQMQPPVSIMDAEALRSALYPWLERSTAPTGTEALLALVANPAIQSQLSAIGVRYFVEFSGGTIMDVGEGGILCAVGYGGGGCFGFAWGSRESSFRATVLDARKAKEIGTEAGQKAGGVYVPAFGLPIPLIAATENAACDTLATRVHALIRGADAVSVPAP